MDYYIDFQYLPKGAARPLDQGEVVNIQASSEGTFAMLPNVGDYVHIDNSTDKGERAGFSGKVRSRVYHYLRVAEDHVNVAAVIVVEETDDDWSKLEKH
ncbi:MAG: hypothetical protein WA825_08325 [Steroidobacteraceae bacterium]